MGKKRTNSPHHQGQERQGRKSYIDMLPQMFRRIGQLETELSGLHAQVSEIYRISLSEKHSAQQNQSHSSRPLHQSGSNRSLGSLSPQGKIERALVLLDGALKEIDNWAMQGAVSQL